MIYLITGAGEPNYGDELITMGWVNYYRKQGYTGPIFIDCKSSQGARKLHGEHDDVQFGRYLKALTMGRDGSFSDYIAAGRNFVDSALGLAGKNPPLLVQRAQARLEPEDIPPDLRSTILVHLVGGGYINGTWPNSFSLLGGASQIARRLGCPVVATGIGLSPLGELTPEDKTELAAALADFGMFELRDKMSFDDLQAQGIAGTGFSIGLDDSFLHPVQTTGNFKGRSLHLPLFGVHLEGRDGKALLENIADHLEEFDRILCWQCNVADVPACEMVERRFPAANVKRLYNSRLLAAGLPFQAGDIMITSRFHPHLMAARYGISGYFLAFSQFYDAKHASVQALGSSFLPYDAKTELDFSATQTLGISTDQETAYITAKRNVAAKIFGMI